MRAVRRRQQVVPGPTPILLEEQARVDNLWTAILGAIATEKEIANETDAKRVSDARTRAERLLKDQVETNDIIFTSPELASQYRALSWVALCWLMAPSLKAFVSGAKLHLASMVLARSAAKAASNSFLFADKLPQQALLDGFACKNAADTIKACIHNLTRADSCHYVLTTSGGRLDTDADFDTLLGGVGAEVLLFCLMRLDTLNEKGELDFACCWNKMTLSHIFTALF
jgi:hypothetical protein